MSEPISESISGNALRGHLETMVLSSLERQEAHGFEILRRLDKAGRGALSMKEGSLYPALYRMEKSGLLKARWDDKTEGRGPRRRVYRLTSKGRRHLQQGRQAWNHFVTIIGPIVGVAT